MHALVRIGELVRVHPHVQLRDVEPEQLDAAPQVGERAVGDARAAVGAKARVHQLEVGEQRGRIVVGGPVIALEQALQPLADEAELAPVGLVEVLVADRASEGGELGLVVRDRAQQLLAHGHHPRRHADGAREVPHLDAVAGERQPARALEPFRDGVGPGLRIAVLVASDPGAEAERGVRSRQPLAVLGQHAGRHGQQRRLEEPQGVADLVDHARTPRAHLVGLPEGGDLGGHAVLEPATRRGRERGIVVRLEDAAELQLRLQHGASRRLRRMRRDHELERDGLGTARELGGLDAARRQQAEGLRERFARDLLLALVAAPAAHAMPGLGDVRELEVEAERAQDGGRALAVE